MSTRIDIRKLKEVARKLDDPLRTLVMSEPDSMELFELVAKGDLWLRLAEIQKN